ncbi:MAG: NAD-dependent epimerase/dehydratase family protein [Planctomycetota bacterium]
MIERKKVLITGGAGFIGTHVAEALAPHNDVTLLDIDLDHVLRFSPLANDDRVRKVLGDVRDPEIVEEEVSKCQILLHYASILGVKKVIDHARDTIDTIILGVRNILEAARKNDEIERIVYISTSEVYGDAMDTRVGALASVGTHNDPRLCYASAKLMGEHQVWAYHRDFDLPTVIVRPFNIYGPYRTASNAVGLFVVKALAGEDVTLYGDGSQLRSWCYIDDFRDGMLACIERREAVGEDFNLGNGVTAATIYDLAQRTIRLAGSSSKIITTDHKFSDIGVRLSNADKARELLEYEPRYDMDAGLVPTIAWHRDHLVEFRHWLKHPVVDRKIRKHEPVPK